MSTHGIDAASGAIPEADVPRRGVLGVVQAGLDGINAVMAVLSAIAIAADTTIRQKGRLFSLEAVSIKIGVGSRRARSA